MLKFLLTKICPLAIFLVFVREGLAPFFLIAHDKEATVVRRQATGPLRDGPFPNGRP